jgi:glycosyl transferase, family 25
VLPVYVINLKRSLHRRKIIERRLKKVKLQYEMVEGVDAVNMPDFKDHVINKNSEVSLARGHVGCVLSHVKVYGIMQEREDPFALIMEDDVIISGNLKKILEKLQGSLSENKICHLSMQCHHPISFNKTEALADGYALYDCAGSIEGARGTQAYIISKKVAGTLAEQLYPVKYNIDSWPLYQAKGYFKNLSIIFPFPVVHEELLSELNEEDRKNIKSLKEWIKYHVYKFKLEPFHTLFLKRRRKRVEERQKKNLFIDGDSVKKTFRI